MSFGSFIVNLKHIKLGARLSSNDKLFFLLRLPPLPPQAAKLANFVCVLVERNPVRSIDDHNQIYLSLCSFGIHFKSAASTALPQRRFHIGVVVFGQISATLIWAAGK